VFRPNYEALACKVHLSFKGRRNKHGRFDWGEAVIDAGIISGLSFFTGLGALAASGSVSVVGGVVLLCACGAEFLSILAAKRRLIPKSC
jgi:hypothetical protein